MVQIAEVPRTLSGKALEVPVKRILMGAAPAEAASVDSLANPQALDYFVELAPPDAGLRNTSLREESEQGASNNGADETNGSPQQCRSPR